MFEEERLGERFRRAVEAASRRATELGSEQGGRADMLTQIGVFLVDVVASFFVSYVASRASISNGCG